MDTANDNPLKRFSTFWLGLLVIGSFGIVCLLLAPWFGREKPASYEMAQSERREAIREEVREAQAGALKTAPASTFTEVGAALLKPAAPVKDPLRILPGSAAAEALKNAPTEKVEIPQVAEGTPVDPAVMEKGKQHYLLCLACHGPEGNGMPGVGPPLAGSEWVTGPVENLIRIQLRGLQGPITVAGKEYNFPAPMVPQAHQTDEQISEVLTFIRNSWGNKATPVTPEQVKALRGEVGKPMLTAADLIPPKPAE